MELSVFFKSVLDADNTAIVLCDINHTIIYMNPTAVERYAKRGGANLIGHSLLACHNEESNSIIRMVIAWFEESKDNNRVFTFHSEKENKDVYMIALRDDSGKLIGYYEKHEYRNPETAPRYNMD
ncbi:MAG: PAS domain-containing protein [Ruminococcus flavefaciens]|nr:PAS domain-containing protein [Ruminococcus flavefaciens]